jgi:hypothetical protein
MIRTRSATSLPSSAVLIADASRTSFGIAVPAAWLAMVLTAGLAVYLNATITGRTGDIDIKTAFEAGVTVTVISILPFGGMAVCVLLPLAAIADRVFRGRRSAWWTTAAGTLFAVPALVMFFAFNWLIWGRHTSPLALVKRAAASRDPVITILVITFAVGGAVVSLGIRRRESDVSRALTNPPNPTHLTN